MSEWPVLVENSEPVVRGICTPYHVSTAGKLKPQAFDPRPGTDTVSVIRIKMIGADACKAHAQTLSRPDQNKYYQGLALIRTSSVRKSGADVVDSRQVFYGHADIKHGYIAEALEPPPPEIVETWKKRSKTLAAAARFFKDPDAAGAGWEGDALVLVDCDS